MIYTLLSTARSGSTWYGTVMTQRYKADFLGEIFHPEIDAQTQKKNLLDIMKEYSGAEKNCVIKVFPKHLLNPTIPNLEKTIFSVSQDIEILVRRNFNDQVRSLYVANEYESLMNPLHSTDSPPTWQDNFDKPLIIDSVDQRRVSFIVRRFNEELVYLSKLYHKHKFKLSYLEDIKDNYKELDIRMGKLNRPVIWNEQLPEIDFSTESLFE